MLGVSIWLRPRQDFIYEADVDELIKELGIVLISVCGVSLFYERVLAERQLLKFHTELQQLNSTGRDQFCCVCSIKGCWRYSTTARSLRAKTLPFSPMTPGNILLPVMCQSHRTKLYFIMLNWERFQPMLQAGAALELCMIDPALPPSPLDYLAHYKPGETEMVVNDIRLRIRPWLEASSTPLARLKFAFTTFTCWIAYLMSSGRARGTYHGI